MDFARGINKSKTPYYFKEGGLTIWLTASQYQSLKKDMPVDRLAGFGPAPPTLNVASSS